MLFRSKESDFDMDQLDEKGGTTTPNNSPEKKRKSLSDETKLPVNDTKAQPSVEKAEKPLGNLLNASALKSTSVNPPLDTPPIKKKPVKNASLKDKVEKKKKEATISLESNGNEVSFEKLSKVKQEIKQNGFDLNAVFRDRELTTPKNQKKSGLSLSQILGEEDDLDD